MAVALLDYLGIDRLEFEFFRQTGRLHAYPEHMVAMFQAAKQAARHLGSVEERLAGREEAINDAVKQLDEVITGILEFDHDYMEG